MTPACFEIASGDWNAAMAGLAQLFVIALALVYAAGIRWWEISDRWRVHRRRLRIRRIRNAGKP